MRPSITTKYQCRRSTIRYQIVLILGPKYHNICGDTPPWQISTMVEIDIQNHEINKGENRKNWFNMSSTMQHISCPWIYITWTGWDNYSTSTKNWSTETEKNLIEDLHIWIQLITFSIKTGVYTNNIVWEKPTVIIQSKNFKYGIGLKKRY